ncbi:GroES-like protein [Microthyrium microscopicum]|uniref:GroES-like protein n=1 Tax=Microthyrium microscopicum TaxID=703497 RepID=A0A6A6ULI3_9PEZI|nr:GroES-like protein [Microthyrium microscopicum]
MRVLKALTGGKSAIKDDVPTPTLRPDYVTVRTKAVALNPTDWKHINFVDTVCTIGCDFAGVIEEVGSAVTKPWKKGDRVFGFVHGGNVVHPEDGAFGEYVTAKGDLLMKIPDDLKFKEAAPLGVGIVTCGLGLYQSLELPWPNEPAKEKFPILIYGGSSATGVMGIQMAKLSGLEVIATCSPRNFDLLKSFGADHVFDYNSPTCAADIKKLTNNSLYYAWDTISEKNSPQICCDALSDQKQPDGNKPQYGSILPVKDFPRSDVEHKYILGYTVVGEEFRMGPRKIEAKPQDFEFTKKFVQVAEKLVAEKKIRPHRSEVRDGGLDGIFGGLDDLKNGKVSGIKIVYKLED